MLLKQSYLAVALVFGASAVSANQVMKAPDEFNFENLGQEIVKNYSDGVNIEILNSSAPEGNGYIGNGAGIHTGITRDGVSPTKVTLTGGDFVITTNDQCNLQAGVDSFGGAELHLGTTSNRLNSLQIKGGGNAPDLAIGLQAWRGHMGNESSLGGGSIDVNAKVVDIDIAAPYARGIYVWNNTTPSSIGTMKKASVTINSDDVRIVARATTEQGNARAIQAWSQGVVDIRAKNLYIEGQDAVNTRGNSGVHVEGSEITQIKGDVNFNYSASTSGTTVDSDVEFILTGENSYWEGGAKATYDSLPSEEYGKVTGMKLSLSNGAQWTPSNVVDDPVGKKTRVAINDFKLNDGVVNINHGSGQEVLIENLSGTGGTINLLGDTKDGKVITSGSLNVANAQADMPLSVNFTGITADDVVDVDAAMKSFEGKVVAGNVTITNTIQEGAINGSIVQVVDSNGQAGEIIQNVNHKLDGYGSIAALSAVQWRHENDALVKRMGDIRDSSGMIGAWARVYGSEQKYGAQSVESKNNTVQLGADYDIGSGWKVGGAFSYTDSSLSFDIGDGDGDSFGAAVYGTWLGGNGQFVDVIAKYSRLSTDFSSGEMSGDYNNNAFSIAAEAGVRFDFGSVGFVEPSVGASYGRIMGDDFVATNGVSVEQDDYDSLTARAGIRAGFFLPNNKGQLYARAAVLHDFMGDVEGTASKANSMNQMQTHQIKEELGGTWVEYGMGGVFKYSSSLTGFVDLERTSGGEVDESWKWTIGGRMMF